MVEEEVAALFFLFPAWPEVAVVDMFLFPVLGGRWRWPSRPGLRPHHEAGLEAANLSS